VIPIPCRWDSSLLGFGRNKQALCLKMSPCNEKQESDLEAEIDGRVRFVSSSTTCCRLLVRWSTNHITTKTTTCCANQQHQKVVLPRLSQSTAGRAKQTVSFIRALWLKNQEYRSSDGGEPNEFHYTQPQEQVEDESQKEELLVSVGMRCSLKVV
jgi:hypothetical protein